MKRKGAVVKGFIALLAFGAIGLTTYVAGDFYYEDRFPANTVVNGVKIGNKNVMEANKTLADELGWEKLAIVNDKETMLTITKEDLDYKFTLENKLMTLKTEDNWVKALLGENEHNLEIEKSFNKEKLLEIIEGMPEFEYEYIEADLVYSEDSNAFEITEDNYELELSREGLYEMVVEKINEPFNVLDLEEYIRRPQITQDSSEIRQAQQRANSILDLTITYDFGDRKEELRGDRIKDWVVFNNGEIEIDTAQARIYANELGAKYDTFGKSRNFTTAAGNQITVNGGSYGWMIHRGNTAQELAEQIEKGESGVLKPNYSYSAKIRNANDIGNTYVEIDLRNQKVYAIKDGQIVVETATVTGDVSKGRATPTGVYPVNYLERNATLTGESYSTPVSYWMPFNNHIGLHDAGWRSSFGGSIYVNNGSHGCVNLPPEKAKAIYELAYPGMPVVVY